MCEHLDNLCSNQMAAIQLQKQNSGEYKKNTQEKLIFDFSSYITEIK